MKRNIECFLALAAACCSLSVSAQEEKQASVRQKQMQEEIKHLKEQIAQMEKSGGRKNG